MKQRQVSDITETGHPAEEVKTETQLCILVFCKFVLALTIFRYTLLNCLGQVNKQFMFSACD